ncbi:hypothetical protein CR513_60781, partial [Mucuna pruriens]
MIDSAWIHEEFSDDKLIKEECDYDNLQLQMEEGCIKPLTAHVKLAEAPNMDHSRWSLPRSNALYGSSIMLIELESSHECPIGKSLKVVGNLIQTRINIMCLQETKWVGEKDKDLDTTGFKLQYTREDRGKNGVHIIVNKNWKSVVNVKV